MFSPYLSRPIHLSNPDEHFSSTELDDIISVPDSKLGWREFRTIFHVGCPAGLFEEIAYFLPFGLEYMLKNPEDSLEFLSGVIYFISNRGEELTRAAILQDCLKSITLIFQRWTNAFTVTHYDELACQRKGWTLKFDNIVENGQSLSQLIDDLWTYRTHASLADKLVSSLAEHEADAIKSAWFLEYAREVRGSYRFWNSTVGREIHANIEKEFGISSDPLTSMPTSISKVIPALTSDHQLLTQHYKLVRRGNLYSQVHPTYWQTIENELNLHGA